MDAPDSTTAMLSLAEVDKVRKIVEEATTMQRAVTPKTNIERRLEILNKWILTRGVAVFLVMVAMAALAFYTKLRPFADVTLVLVVLVKLFVFGTLFIIILVGILFFWQLKKSPFGPFFSQVKSSGEMDFPFVLRLAQCERSAIQYVLNYYKYERAGFEKRGSLLAGSVERIGLFPALAGLLLLVAGLAKITEVATWAVIFGPIIFAFYMMNIATFSMQQKMDRVIGMLEFCIQARK